MDRKIASIITKMETFIVWINFTSIGTELYQFDVACAFLNANLDEGVYAPKAWFLRFSSFLRDFGFISSECEPGVWTLLAADGSGSLLAILCVYVDDIMLATSPSSNIQERFQPSLFTTFDATTDGLCTWLLGMAIDRKHGGVIHLHQEKYINDILTTFNMTECTPRRLPCTPDTDFHDLPGAPLDTKLFPYPNLIAMSVLRYLKGTPSHGLIFRKQLDNETPDFIFFVGADWATFMPKRRSTTGNLALVHGTPVAYRAQVQKSMAMSTAEAEFVALCMTCTCLAFICILLRQLSHPTTDPVDDVMGVGEDPVGEDGMDIDAPAWPPAGVEPVMRA
eukprot:jgi/Tetstr1/426152/TSEL_016479.t1